MDFDTAQTPLTQQRFRLQIGKSFFPLRVVREQAAQGGGVTIPEGVEEMGGHGDFRLKVRLDL